MTLYLTKNINQVTKLDHHRGSVTTVKVIQDGEILVTCSQDGTVCTWNVDNFTLLSTVNAGVPIHTMEVTDDNVFLITLQGENELHVRTFITGTHLHVLKRHKAKVSYGLFCDWRVEVSFLLCFFFIIKLCSIFSICIAFLRYS